MHVARALGPFVLASLMIVGCGSSTGTDGAGGGGDGGGGTGGANGSTTSGVACGTDLTHCTAGLFHCENQGVSFFTCAEYSGADAATYESICKDGGGTWSEGCCDETGVLGQCLPQMYCAGMGIGFEYADAAGAEESCKSTGGTWVPAP